MKNIYLTIISSFCIMFGSYAQPAIQWQNSYGGTLSDHFESGGTHINNAISTSDGGIFIAAHSYSNDGDVSGHHGLSGTSDIWVVKIDSLGYIEWQKSLGGTYNEDGYGCIQTSDGGYLIIGSSFSDDGDVTGHHDTTSTADVWVVKIDSLGNIQWNNSYGGSDYDIGRSIIETADGNFVFAADSRSSDGDVSAAKGFYDCWIVKINTSGSILWEYSLGGSGSERITTINNTNDGGFICAAMTTSIDGDISNNPYPGFLWSAWVVKLDSIAGIEWEHVYGGTFIDDGRDIKQTNDGGYIFSVTSASTDGDITCNNGTASSDAILMKLDDTGIIQWLDCYGGTSSENVKTVLQTSDGGFLVGCLSSSADGDVSANYGGIDYWLFKTDSMGVLQWEKNYGGSGADILTTVLQTNDGGVIIAGESLSNDFDVSGHHGALTENDVWVAKLAPLTIGFAESELPVNLFTITPNPIANQALISFEVLNQTNITIDLFDLSGRKINTLYDGLVDTGKHELVWNIADNENRFSLSGGSYFITIATNEYQISKKIIVIK